MVLFVEIGNQEKKQTWLQEIQRCTESWKGKIRLWLKLKNGVQLKVCAFIKRCKRGVFLCDTEGPVQFFPSVLDMLSL